VKGQPPAPSPFTTASKKRRARETNFSSRKALRQCLRDSNKPHGLFNWTGIGGGSSISA